MTAVGPERLRVLGVRHHGPGSARAVRRALAAFQPEIVLIEGPPEADRIVEYAAAPGMEPPVALLAYAPDAPGVAAFWPFAVFSPEWQALTWAAANRAEVRFCDLPAASMLALRETTGVRDPPSRDPIAMLARAAGYDDPERWWDDVMELRLTGDPFDAVIDAMAELRAGETDDDPVGQLREAAMRRVLRAALKTGDRVAVVCGAWHAPALTGRLPPASADAALLKGVARRKTVLTWVPWTHSRLGLASGYGAGVDSPGWYHHLFTARNAVVERWLAEVAHVLRRHDLAVSAAHVVEAVRLAETLAAVRGRPLAGLAEVTDATLAVLCDGNPVSLALIKRETTNRERLGTVPEGAPGVPLEADLRASARSLRLKFTAEPRELTLDLRKSTDLARSRLLHRLGVVGVDWGRPRPVTGEGTFKEGWQLEWYPELSVRVIEASLWGTTLADAATARIVADLDSLREVTGGVAAALRADLPAALPDLLRALDVHAAADTDVAQLLEAFPALVRARRYGDVRGTGTARLVAVTDALLVRICAGLPLIAGRLGAEAARTVVGQIDAVQSVLPLLGDPQAEARWARTLTGLLERADVQGLLAGRLVRLLTDAGVLAVEGAATRLSRALSVGASTSPADQAYWMEGFLAGGALLLIHDDRILALVDRWVRGLDDDAFLTVLPLVRRTFGDFEPAERRHVAARAAGLAARPDADARPTTALDHDRAAPALATVDLILGLP